MLARGAAPPGTASWDAEVIAIAPAPAVEPAPSDPVQSAVPLRALSSGSGIRIPFVAVTLLVWLADVLAIGAAILALQPLTDASGIDWSRRLLPIALACYTGIAQVAGAYDLDNLIRYKRCWPRVANAWLSTILAIAAITYAVDVLERMPLLNLVAWFLAGFASIAGMRAASTMLVRSLKRAGAFSGRTAIVGTGVQGIELVDYVSRSDELAISLVGFYADEPVTRAQEATLPLPYRGDLADLVEAIRGGAIDKVLLALPWTDEVRLHRVLEQLSTTPAEIRLAPERAGFAYARRRVASLAGLSVITLMEQPLTGIQRFQKALEDRLLALAALILFAPLMLLVACAIKLTSPGPVLFRQVREGFNCRVFEILKFRTMHLGSCGSTEVVQARRGDARITRLGAWLRRTSIDELPQLINVLLGHMSLVGPRPHAPSTRAGGRLFADIASSYAARHKVKPGLTGWAQVCGWRGETDTEEKLIRRLEHDMYYVEHWSIWFDLYILARTVTAVLLHRAY
jgi:polysaccharide biosynthesis protein PslA